MESNIQRSPPYTPSPFKISFKLFLLLIIFLILLSTVGILFIKYEGILNKNKQLDLSYQNLNDKYGQLQQDSQKRTQNYNDLQNLAKQYLTLENHSCPQDQTINQCIQDLIKQYGSKSGLDCSTIPDNVCESWCVAGTDYDCCIKAGYTWIQGRGCYPKTTF